MFEPYAYLEVTIFHFYLFTFTIIDYQVETNYYLHKSSSKNE
jgi:hypothetical protein